MAGGYRVVIAGALAALVFVSVGFGWTLGVSTAQTPNPTASAQRADAVKRIEGGNAEVSPVNSELAERVHRAKYEKECAQGDDKRDSDLCAQWKAADAATVSASFTYWGNWIGGISGIFVLVALGFAFEANRIARDTAKRELRAYLYVELKEAPKLELGGWPKGEFWLKNGGQTPAHNVRMSNAFSIGKYPFEGGPPPLPEESFAGGGHHPPNTPTVITCKAHEGGLTQPWIDAITKGSRRIVMYGEIRYEDIFGEEHVTRYRAEYGGPDTITGDCVLWAHEGNEAT